MIHLCDYSDLYILVKGTITINGAEANSAAQRADERIQQVTFRSCIPFKNCTCISEINNTQVDNAKDLDVVMLMYNKTEYRDNYAKISQRLWQWHKHNPNDNSILSHSNSREE